jgi:hypothetical protein
MNNKKFLTLAYDGINYRIPLNNIVTVGTTSTTVFNIQYLDTVTDVGTLGNTALTKIDIQHVADTTSHEFKLWFIGQMEDILGTNWRVTSKAVTPPLALTGVPS